MIDRAYMQRMARYNRWQNENLYGTADRLSDAERRRGRGAFFGFITKRLSLLRWADSVDPAWLAADQTFYSVASKSEWTHPRWVLVTHMFNHQTHHRGQVHSMLTQAGGKPSDTDLTFMPPD